MILSRSERKRVVAGGLVALAAGILLTGAFALDVLRTTQARATDALFALRPGQVARSTVIVGIDQRSYQALLPTHGPLSAWPRALYARAIDALGRAGARVIMLNIFFDAPKPGDAELGAAMRRAGNVVIPVVAEGPERFDPRPGVAQDFRTVLRPTGVVRDAAADQGLANVTTAPDGVVRSVPLLLRAGGEELPSLALTTVARFTRRSSVLDAPAVPGIVYAAGRAIPVLERDTMMINFLGPPSDPERGGAFRIVSFVDLLEGRADPGALRDRIALIAPTIRGVDEYVTPTSTTTRMWGIEVLGNAIETVLHQQFLVEAPKGVTIASILAMAALAGSAVALLRPWRAALAVLSLLALYVTAAIALFESGRVVNLVYPPAAVLIGFAAALAYRVVFEQAEQRMVREAMARYLSPSVSQWVLADPERLQLGGETREMTVLFSDLRNFTALAHDLPAPTLVALLNAHRAEMTDVVFAHDGVLAQYAGDAIEAFWNAPMSQPDHARRACATALDMIVRLERLEPEFERRGWKDLDMGVGINTGIMVVGNMGSPTRLAYTAVGDAVNVAARLEGLSKEYGVRIVIGEATRAAAGDAFAYRLLDLVAVKGRDEPLSVYELLGPVAALDPARRARLERYHEGVRLYRQRRWQDASRVLAALAREIPDDGPVEVYLRRAREFLEHPPAEDWDGVYVARTK